MLDLFLCLFTDVLIYANQPSFVHLEHYLLNYLKFILRPPFFGFHDPVPPLILVDYFIFLTTMISENLIYFKVKIGIILAVHFSHSRHLKL